MDNIRELQEDAFQKSDSNYGGYATKKGLTPEQYTKTSLNIMKHTIGKIKHSNKIF